MRRVLTYGFVAGSRSNEHELLLEEIRSELKQMISEMKLILPPVDERSKTDEKIKFSAAEATEAHGKTSLNTNTHFSSPIAGEYRISSNYGYRTDPFNRKRAFHKGIDIPVPKNTPVYASKEGIVDFAGRDRYNGKFIRITHDNNYQTIYGHLSQIKVKKGKMIKKGDVIGYSGNTGRSTGPHLHYQVNYKGDSVNPNSVLNK